MNWEEGFWAKVDKSGDCWLWTAGMYTQGYGAFAIRRKSHRAHRLAYQLLVGPIPKGLELDHLCRNRACVNPAHLEPVTHRENILRGESPIAAHARRTHCPQGHAYTTENTAFSKKNGARLCRACNRQKATVNRAKARRERQMSLFDAA